MELRIEVNLGILEEIAKDELQEEITQIIKLALKDKELASLLIKKIRNGTLGNN